MIGDRRRAEIAGNLIAVRAARRRSFPSELFDEFAWTMLLVLFVASVDNRILSEETLFGLSDVSASVGRNWLRHLVKDGQLAARHDGDDVTMTATAIVAMREFLDRAAELHASTRLS